MSNDPIDPEAGAPAGPQRHTGTQRPIGPRPLGALADLAELLGGESAGSRRFLGGLAVGAIVGAALAGGSLLRRRSRGTPTD